MNFHENIKNELKLQKIKIKGNILNDTSNVTGSVFTIFQKRLVQLN